MTKSAHKFRKCMYMYNTCSTCIMTKIILKTSRPTVKIEFLLSALFRQVVCRALSRQSTVTVLLRHLWFSAPAPAVDRIESSGPWAHWNWRVEGAPEAKNSLVSVFLVGSLYHAEFVQLVSFINLLNVIVKKTDTFYISFKYLFQDHLINANDKLV